jgi:hypothetical protein
VAGQNRMGLDSASGAYFNMLFDRNVRTDFAVWTYARAWMDQSAFMDAYAHWVLNSRVD